MNYQKTRMMQSFFEHFLLFNSVFFFLLNNVNYRFQKYFDSLKSMKTYKIDWIYELLEDTHDAIFFRTFSAI